MIPPRRYAGSPGFFLEIVDRFPVRIDLGFHALEFRERFLTLGLNLPPLCWIVTRGAMTSRPAMRSVNDSLLIAPRCSARR